MAPSLEAMNGSKGVESDPRIQTLTAEQKQALFAKFEGHPKEEVEKALKYAEEQIINLELWSWVDPHLPEKVKALRQKKEAPLYDEFMKEFLKGRS